MEEADLFDWIGWRNGEDVGEPPMPPDQHIPTRVIVYRGAEPVVTRAIQRRLVKRGIYRLVLLPHNNRGPQG